MKRRRGTGLKIIGGSARGRAIQAPPGRTTRPILAVLKERLFNILGQRLDGLSVWDLFAGSGSLGLEALSRGAVTCTFLERDRTALGCLTENLAGLQLEGRAKVLRSDVFGWAANPGESPVDLIFCDPPYPLYDSQAESLHRLIDDLIRVGLVLGGRLCLRTPAAYEWPGTGVSQPSDRRVHGENAILIFEVTIPDSE